MAVRFRVRTRLRAATANVKIHPTGQTPRYLVFRWPATAIQRTVSPASVTEPKSEPLPAAWNREGFGLPKRIGHWSLISLQQRLVKAGGRLVKHARYYWLLLAESHLTRRAFAAILRRTLALPLPVG